MLWAGSRVCRQRTSCLPGVVCWDLSRLYVSPAEAVSDISWQHRHNMFVVAWKRGQRAARRGLGRVPRP